VYSPTIPPLLYACVVVVEMCLQSHCLVRVISSGFTVLAFRRHVTVYNVYDMGLEKDVFTNTCLPKGYFVTIARTVLEDICDKPIRIQSYCSVARLQGV
jgi:hypothetical protein